HEEALAAYDEAIAVKPDYQEAWYAKGSTCDTLGRKEEAKAAFAKALSG
ncbi:MAG: tetratricopeptide repeat protein, partial [Deltaproteobacteria bacterium]|nr:tetratricopeptide repeat protein [Deltaproteobacteria bacterium]